MKKIICKTVLLMAGIVFNYTLSAQVSTGSNSIKSLYENGHYHEIIDQYAGTPRNLSSTELTYIAQAYLHINDTDMAARYADMAANKNPKDANIFYIKGMLAHLQENQQEAMKAFNEAIKLSPRMADSYTGLADIYYAQEKTRLALQNYRKAISVNPPSEKAYYMIGAINAGEGNMNAALDTFYIAKSKIIKDKELLVTVLYNIGQLEYDNKNYNKAIKAYQELISYIPDDYYSQVKLVQCYNILGQYEKANTQKRELYNAYNKGSLPSDLSDQFAIDQFTVGNKEVFGYERYQQPAGYAFVKNIFYVINNEGNIEESIFMEYTPPTANEKSGSYNLSIVKGIERSTFNTTFEETVSYSTVKSYIEDIVNGKIQSENSR